MNIQIKKVVLVFLMATGGLSLLLRRRLAGFLLVLAGMGWMAAAFRCPHCRKYLGKDYIPGKYCPHCGEKIDQ